MQFTPPPILSGRHTPVRKTEGNRNFNVESEDPYRLGRKDTEPTPATLPLKGRRRAWTREVPV